MLMLGRRTTRQKLESENRVPKGEDDDLSMCDCSLFTHAHTYTHTHTLRTAKTRRKSTRKAVGENSLGAAEQYWTSFVQSKS
jgi:hypothetical protein